LAATHVDEHGAHAHHSELAHHFDNLEQQREAGNIGMWVFLVQEIMFFGGLFMAYSLYRAKYPQAFAAASNHLNITLGATNTVVLILSSLTMALAVYFAQTGKRRAQVLLLCATLALGATFLVIKGFEYADKFHDGLVPVAGMFHPDQHLVAEWAAAGAPVQNVQLFYWIYFAMTGLHALHMIVGIGIIAYLIFYARKGRFTPEYHSPVEISGLYWHFVDIVWIFLFPLLYLLGRHFGEGH
jgi:cytochrome c oxidase subunit 3